MTSRAAAVICGLISILVLVGCDDDCPTGGPCPDGMAGSICDTGPPLDLWDPDGVVMDAAEDQEVPDAGVPDTGVVDADILDADIPDMPLPDASIPAGWVIPVDGSGYDGIWNIVIDGNGDLVVSGHFSGIVTLGSYTLTATAFTNTFIAKLDPDGNVLWAVPIAGDSTWMALLWDGLGVDASGNIYYAGQFSGTATFGTTTLDSQGDQDVFVTKLDPNGNILWAQSAGGPGKDQADVIAVASDGTITIGGFFSDTAEFGATSLIAAGPSDIFVARLDASGSFVWAVPAGSDAEDEVDMALDLILDNTGNIYVTGRTGMNASFGSHAFVGEAAGTFSAYLTKLDPAGNFLWVKALGPAAVGVDMDRDPSGHLYITSHLFLWGTFPDVAKAAMVWKVDQDGNEVWRTFIPASENFHGNRLAVDHNGNATLVGYFWGTGVLGTTVISSTGTGNHPFIAWIDTNGKVTGGEQIPTTLTGSAIGVALDAYGNTYVTGQFMGTGSFGGTDLTSNGNFTDAFIWKRGP